MAFHKYIYRVNKIVERIKNLIILKGILRKNKFSLISRTLAKKSKFWLDENFTWKIIYKF